MPQREIEILGVDDCKALLATGAVGRALFVDEDGPGAVPVNFGVTPDEIVFRVSADSALRHMAGKTAGFEVDHLEEVSRMGWSVLVRGEAREVAQDDVPALVGKLGPFAPSPWAQGIHNTWLAIRFDVVTGRRLTEPFAAALF